MPKKGSSDDMQLSAAEIKMIALCFKYMKGNPEIDFEGVAREYGYGSASIARTRYSAVRSTCREMLAKTEANEDHEPNTPAKTTPKKRKSTGEGSVKKSRKPKTAKTVVSAGEIGLARLDSSSPGKHGIKEESVPLKKEEFDEEITNDLLGDDTDVKVKA